MDKIYICSPYNHKNLRLWRFINHYNRAVAINTARNIVAYAQETGAQVIVFEHLQMHGKKRGSKKQRLSLWRKRDIQHRVKEMAAQKGIRVLLKSVFAKRMLQVQAKVPELGRRTSCVLTTLIHFSAVLGTLKTA